MNVHKKNEDDRAVTVAQIEVINRQWNRLCPECRRRYLVGDPDGSMTIERCPGECERAPVVRRAKKAAAQAEGRRKSGQHKGKKRGRYDK
jgi:hypothetical protein